jgi:metal-responsive CopG/Arc/MetJ family transcriptional regulator
VEVPEPLMEAIDETAAASDQKRSEFVRELLVLGLAARGAWPRAPFAKAS